MTKVLNIISDTNIGGAGRCLLNFLKYYDRSRYEVKVVLPENSLLRPAVLALDTPVIEVAGMADKSLSLSAIRNLKQVIRSEAPQIVHTHGAVSGRVAAKGTGAKIIYTRHSAFPLSPKVTHGVGKFLYKHINEHYADRIIAVSDACRQNLIDGGIDEAIIDTMMNGVEPVPRKSAEEIAALKVQYGIPEDAFVLGILARIEEYKGHIHILRAMELLLAEGRKVHLLIAGEGGYAQTLRDQCRDMGLDPAVTFLGFTSDISGFLSVLDVQLNASYVSEACSLSLLEGLSMGLPAVVSDCGGNPTLIDDGVDGLIFPKENIRALADAVGKLMDDPERLAAMGKNALEVYRRRFTGEVFARNVEAVYQKALEG